jgi:hypothetical protein
VPPCGSEVYAGGRKGRLQTAAYHLTFWAAARTRFLASRTMFRSSSDRLPPVLIPSRVSSALASATRCSIFDDGSLSIPTICAHPCLASSNKGVGFGRRPFAMEQLTFLPGYRAVVLGRQTMTNEQGTLFPRSRRLPMKSSRSSDVYLLAASPDGVGPRRSQTCSSRGTARWLINSRLIVLGEEHPHIQPVWGKTPTTQYSWANSK